MAIVTQESIEQGQRILETRIKKGLKQEQLSSLSGISVTYISRIEKGHVNVSKRTLIAMSKALECSLEYLEKGYEQQPTNNDISYGKTTYSSNASSDKVKRFRKSEPLMKEKDFNKYRKEIRETLDDILYLYCDDDMVKAIHRIVDKLNEYSFAREQMEQMSVGGQAIYHDRCLKYIGDITSELEYQIDQYLQEE